MRITSCGMTDVGMKRTNNEDNYLINDELNLFVCCDGMGGHVGGEFASAIAVNTVEEVLTSLEYRPEEHGLDADDGPVEITREKLRYAVRLAGRRIFEKATEEPEYKGMGTTCLALLIENGNAYLAHVGDSRGYVVRDGVIEQLTEDHSLVNEKIKAGLITPEEAKTHKLKNIIPDSSVSRSLRIITIRFQSKHHSATISSACPWFLISLYKLSNNFMYLPAKTGRCPGLVKA